MTRRWTLIEILYAITIAFALASVLFPRWCPYHSDIGL